MAMKTKQIYCILLKLLGNFKIIPTKRQKMTINFLKAMNAANGINVKQNEDKIFIVHMMKEYGSIKVRHYFFIFPPPMVENTATLTNL